MATNKPSSSKSAYQTAGKGTGNVAKKVGKFLFDWDSAPGTKQPRPYGSLSGSGSDKDPYVLPDGKGYYPGGVPPTPSAPGEMRPWWSESQMSGFEDSPASAPAPAARPMVGWGEDHKQVVSPKDAQDFWASKSPSKGEKPVTQEEYEQMMAQLDGMNTGSVPMTGTPPAPGHTQPVPAGTPMGQPNWAALGSASANPNSKIGGTPPAPSQTYGKPDAYAKTPGYPGGGGIPGAAPGYTPKGGALTGKDKTQMDGLEKQAMGWFDSGKPSTSGYGGMPSDATIAQQPGMKITGKTDMSPAYGPQPAAMAGWGGDDMDITAKASTIHDEHPELAAEIVATADKKKSDEEKDKEKK
jgi:hypothetical protein